MLIAMDKAQIAQALFLDPLNDGMNLLRRYQEGQGFRGYVMGRTMLLAPIAVLLLLTSLACAAATVMYLGGLQPLLVLLSLLLAPVILVGSAFVQAYVFLSWLENRALAKALRRAPRPAGPIAAQLRKAGIDLGTMPRVPWILAFVFLFLPLSMLVAIMPGVGMALIALHIISPIAFARLDR
jgi:hypothetical protein